MFGFLIKKSFCDGWDNLLSVILTNVIFLFLGIGIIFLNAFAYLSKAQLFMILAFIISVFLISIIALAYGESAGSPNKNRLFVLRYRSSSALGFASLTVDCFAGTTILAVELQTHSNNTIIYI